MFKFAASAQSLRAEISNFQKFLHDDRGVVAMLFTFSLLPLLLVIGVAIDYGYAHRVQVSLQQATDAAALAGASNNGGTSVKMQIAEATFRANINQVSASLSSINPIVNVNGNHVSIRATTDVPTSFLSIVQSSIPLSAKSTAKSYPLSGAPLCILALNETMQGGIRLQGTADLLAPTCAVHGNSNHLTDGLEAVGSPTGHAKNWCVVGGATAGGHFTPNPITGCPVVPDPFAGEFTPSELDGEESGININKSCNYTSAWTPPSSSHSFGSGTWKFCNTVDIRNGETVTLNPGTYIFTSTLTVQAGGRLRSAGPGVTLYFLNGGNLDVRAGAELEITAPQSGKLAGMALVHQEDGALPGSSQGVTHTIIGGGKVDIIGILYAPNSNLYITGNGDINQNSKYFAMVADSINLEGNGVLNVNMDSDNASEGMPDAAVPWRLCDEHGFGGRRLPRRLSVWQAAADGCLPHRQCLACFGNVVDAGQSELPVLLLPSAAPIEPARRWSACSTPLSLPTNALREAPMSNGTPSP